MSEEPSQSFHVPISCPFTIEEIQTSGLTNSKTYLIREHDRYGEFPHIYAKICGTSSSATQGSNPTLRPSKICWAPGVATQDELGQHQVIVLSDTGCGTEVPNSSSHPTPPARGHGEQNRCNMRTGPEVWNIRTFLEYTINPGGKVPYLVMTTHCHYDHIMGIGRLPPTSTTTEQQDRRDLGEMMSDGSARPPTTVLSSSFGKSFVTPYSNLQNHSLCDKLDLQAPRYDVGIWAKDLSRVVYTHSPISTSSSRNTSPRPPLASITTPLTILHTPGHTPDSLSWYDSDLRLLCVGDSFYVKETSATQNAKWGPEPPMPVIFDLESDLGQWWRSLKKVLDFVRERNAETEKEEGHEDESLRAGTKEDNDADADAEHDEGFVYIDADDVVSATSTKDMEVDFKERSRAQAQQTGFDMPSPSKRGIIALPILATPRGHLPTDLDKTDDVWMMVVDPVARPRPRRNPEHPARLRLDPVITSHRVHPPRALPSVNKDRILPPAPCPSSDIPSQARRRPRVRLCAAHTTLSVDAERAILSIRRFMTRILENDVPSRRAEDGPRGEERWLWDDALSSASSSSPSNAKQADNVEAIQRRDARSTGLVGNGQSAPNTGRCRSGHGHGHGHGYSYSVVAPLSVINQGRRSIGIPGRPAGVV